MLRLVLINILLNWPLLASSQLLPFHENLYAEEMLDLFKEFNILNTSAWQLHHRRDATFAPVSSKMTDTGKDPFIEKFKILAGKDVRWNFYARFLASFHLGRKYVSHLPHTGNSTDLYTENSRESFGSNWKWPQCNDWIFRNCTFYCPLKKNSTSLDRFQLSKGITTYWCKKVRTLIAFSPHATAAYQSCCIPEVECTCVNSEDDCEDVYLTEIRPGNSAFDSWASLSRQCILWDDDTDFTYFEDSYGETVSGNCEHEGLYAFDHRNPGIGEEDTLVDPWKAYLTLLADILTRAAVIVSIVWPIINGVSLFSIAAIISIIKKLQLLGVWPEIIAIIRKTLTFLPRFIQEPLDLLVQFLTPLLNLFIYVYSWVY